MDQGEFENKAKEAESDNAKISASSSDKQWQRPRLSCCFFATLLLIIITVIIGAFVFTVYYNGGFASLFTGPRQENKTIFLSSSNIRGALAQDKWIVAQVRGEISDKIELERDYLPKLIFYLRPLPVFFNYTIPVNDSRWRVEYRQHNQNGKKNEYVILELPELEFDNTATLIDISKLEIGSDNYSFMRFESTAEQLRNRLVGNIVEKYAQTGVSPASMVLAKVAAEKTLRDFVEIRLLENGVKLGEDATLFVKWLPKKSKNAEESK